MVRTYVYPKEEDVKGKKINIAWRRRGAMVKG